GGRSSHDGASAASSSAVVPHSAAAASGASSAWPWPRSCDISAAGGVYGGGWGVAMRHCRSARAKKNPPRGRVFRVWQPRMDSNHRMPESESGALPLGDGAVDFDCNARAWPRRQRRLALRELGGAAGLVQADLLALDLARVAGHEPGLAQLGLQRLVVLDQRAGDAQADGAGLAGGATALDRGDHVELLGRLGQLERLAHDHARGLAAEELVQRTLVDGDGAAALAQEHAGGGGLAAAGA